MENKISVIIPVWKASLEQLRQCLDSILNQTYAKLEIIIVYRNSKQHDDGFFSLVEKYNDNRLKVITSKTNGFVNSLNEGIMSSTGELVARIDADDYCDSKRFEKQLGFKQVNKLNIVGTWAYRISDEDEIIGKIEVPTTHEQIRKKIMFHCPMLHPSILVDKETLHDIGYYDSSFIHAEDYELYFRAMAKGYKFGNVPEFLTFIREASGSRSRGSEWKKQRLYYVKAKNKAFREYGFNKPSDTFYYFSTIPFAYFMAPRIWSKLNILTGWSKKTKN